MFLITWIDERNEVNYKIANTRDISKVMASLGQHAIIQKLAS